MAGVPSTIFGANLVRHFLEGYSAGTWTDDTLTLDATQTDPYGPPTQKPVTTRRFARTYLSFDGSDDVVATGTADLSAGDLTVGFRMVSSTVPGGEVYMLAHGYGGFAWGIGASPAWADGRLGMTVDTGTWVESNVSLCDGVERNVIFTIGIAAGMRMYVDGVLQTVTQPGVTAIGTAADSVAIGGLCAADGSTVVLNHAFEIGNLFIAAQEADSFEVQDLDAYLRMWASPVVGVAGPPRAAPRRPAAPLSAARRPPRLPTAAAPTVFALARPALRPARPPAPAPRRPMSPARVPAAPTFYGLASARPRPAVVAFRGGVPLAPALAGLLAPMPLLARTWLPPGAVRAVARGPMAPAYLLAVPIVPVVVARVRSRGELRTAATSAGEGITRVRSTGETRTSRASAGETITAVRSRGERRTP